jgi:hypothetical protein
MREHGGKAIEHDAHDGQHPESAQRSEKRVHLRAGEAARATSAAAMSATTPAARSKPIRAGAGLGNARSCERGREPHRRHRTGPGEPCRSEVYVRSGARAQAVVEPRRERGHRQLDV